MDDFEARLAAARAGDEAAFVELFRAVQPTLLRYLTTLGGPLGEDAAAETWVSVVKGLSRFSGDEAGWRAWVLTIGHARLRDAQRRSYRDPVPVDAHAELADAPDTAARPEKGLRARAGRLRDRPGDRARGCREGCARLRDRQVAQPGRRRVGAGDRP
jgi:RNA polymerase sigma-70 factor (ECF subfamily)